jgi:hypothetical protein
MKRYIHPFAILALPAALLFSCPPYATAQQWGTIKGKVVYGGDNVPARPAINVNGNVNAAQCLANGPVLSDELVVNPKNKGVHWAFVWLQAAPGEKLSINPQLQAPRAQQVELDQPCCMFVPHALAMREGQVLLVKNSAPFAHNTKWDTFTGEGGNVLIPAGGKLPIKDLKAQRYPIKISCNIHGWMGAYLRVFDHPYFAVTDEDGNFEIKDAPAGEHRMVVWQETVGYVTKNVKPGEHLKDGQPITIRPGGVTEAGEFKVPAK